MQLVVPAFQQTWSLGSHPSGFEPLKRLSQLARWRLEKSLILLQQTTCLQLPMHFLQLSEIEQRLRQISWALKALMQELMQDSRQIMLQCPKFPLLSQSWEVRNPVKVGSCNLSLPSSHHKCSYPKVRTNRVQSNHCGKWLPALAKPGPTIREAFQYGYRLLRLQSDPACEPPAESMSSMSHGTRPPGISSLTEANEPPKSDTNSEIVKASTATRFRWSPP